MQNGEMQNQLAQDGVLLSLAGRTALITGGSRGIGAATVRLFRQAGARVAFSYQQATAQAEALATSLGGPTLCLPIQQTLATPEDGEALVARTLAAFGDLDIPIATNIDSVFGLVHAAAAHMLTRPRAEGDPNTTAGCVPLQPARGHIVLIA